MRGRYPEGGAAYWVCESVGWRCNDEAQQAAALEAVEFALRPAPENDVAQALYTLRILTRGRDRYEADDREAEAIVWLAQLREFPADIVLATLKDWPSRPDGQWWPTWHDVHKVVDAATTARRMLAEHILSGACLTKPLPRPDLDRDDSPEGVAYRKAVVERELRKLPSREPAPPTDIVEDYDDWEKRKLDEIRSESRAGKYRLSAEALAIYGAEPPARTEIPNPDRSAAA